MNSGPGKDLVVIQCPSCHAKFALQTKTLEGIEFPRFHCSRCDHIFSKEESLHNDSAAAQDSNESRNNSDFEIDPWQSGDDAEKDESWTMDRKQNGGEEFHKSLEVPRSYNPKQSLSAPHENAAAESRREKPAKGASQVEFDFATSRSDAADASDDDSWAAVQIDMPEREKEMQFSYREEAAGVSDKALAKLPAQIAWQALLRQRPAVWRGCLFLAGPIVIFLMLLWGIGQILEANPNGADWISQQLFPNAERVAPEGLLISEIKQREVDLEDGERIRLISGTLENRSKQSFHDIQLEALTFDKTGKRLSSLKVDAGSTLAKTRVKSLSLEMIKLLQSTAPAKRFELKPDQTSDFAIAIPLEGDSDAHYYSARVYSVKN